MPSKRRIWLFGGLLCLALIGVGFALDASLPPSPRLVLRGPHAPGKLSADGKVLTTGTLDRDGNGELVCVSLKTWDTFTGRERGEFFRGLVGSHEDTITAGSIGGRALVDPDAQGFSMANVVYSPDRRYCALLHRRGMALADLHTGREWPVAVKSKIVEHVSSETTGIYRLLQQLIATKGLQERVKLKFALEYFADQFGGKLFFLVDKEALAEGGADTPDPYEEEVCLPTVPTKVTMNVALRLVLSQIGKGNADYVIRRSFIEITTSKRVRENEVWPPVFSPRGSFVALVEGRPKENLLHVVECASGQLLASLPFHADAYHQFGFTPDDELLYFFANEKQKPVFSVWSTRTKQIVRTIKDIELSADASAYLLAPDGKTLLVNTDSSDPGGVDLYDLQTGRKRRCFDVPGSPRKPADRELRQFTFSPDNRTLVSITAGELQLWDLPGAKKRGSIKLGRLNGHWPPLFISADSRLLCALSDETRPGPTTAWSLETGDRLWPRAAPEIEEVPPNPLVLEVHEFMGHVDIYPRFTPDRRYLVERASGRIDILDPATGAVRARLSLGEDASSHGTITFTPDGSTMVTKWGFDEKGGPWFFQEWLGKWWPFPETTGCHVVTDVPTGRIALRVNGLDWRADSPAISDDGLTVVTFSSDDENQAMIKCWDVPGRPSRRLVFGIPLALGITVALVRWWFVRKKSVVHPNAASKTEGNNDGKS